MREPNRLLRHARLVRVSPSGSGRPMARQEVADAINKHLYAAGSTLVASAEHVARLERGEIRWPRAPYRAAFRAVFGVQTDAQLGFYITRAAPTLDDEPREPVVHPEHIRDAQRDLGRRLAAARKAAKLTQVALAQRVGYARSSIANIEVGRESGARQFWESADQELGAGRVLLKSFDALEALIQQHQQQHTAHERATRAWAHGFACGCGLVVGRWRAADVRALREAMRQPVRTFADKLGVHVGTVTAWESPRRAVPIALAAQDLLDSALKLADPDVRSRFAQLRDKHQASP